MSRSWAERCRALAVRLWAAPNTLIGLVMALVLGLGGARFKQSRGVLEVCFRPTDAQCGPVTRRLPFRGIVFGHVILAVTEEELKAIGPHERVHVRQYERWGPLFLPAYVLSGLWQWLHGRRPYWDNPFEVEARALGRDTGTGPHR